MATKAAATQASTFSHPGAMQAGKWSTTTKNSALPIGLWLVRSGDLFDCGTHGTGQIITGTASKARDLDGKTFAKVDDTAACGAIILTGDPDIQLS